MDDEASCEPHYRRVAEQEWPETLHKNKLFDLHSSVCVIIFLSDAYSYTDYADCRHGVLCLSVYLTESGR